MKKGSILWVVLRFISLVVSIIFTLIFFILAVNSMEGKYFILGFIFFFASAWLIEHYGKKGF